MSFSAKFACVKCGLETRAEAATMKRLAHAVFTSAIAFHAAPKTTGNGDAHCEHLVVLRECDFPEEDSRELHIECLAAGCKERATPTVLATTCPLSLVGTVTLCFHAAHEGHPFRVTWDGAVLAESPRPA